MALLALVRKFGQQMALLALVINFATKWRYLYWFQSWPPVCTTCIVTLPWIAILALSVSIELVSSSARVTSVKSQKGHLERLGPIDRTPGIPGSDKNLNKSLKINKKHKTKI